MKVKNIYLIAILVSMITITGCASSSNSSTSTLTSDQVSSFGSSQAQSSTSMGAMQLNSMKGLKVNSNSEDTDWFDVDFANNADFQWGTGTIPSADIVLKIRVKENDTYKSEAEIEALFENLDVNAIPDNITVEMALNYILKMDQSNQVYTMGTMASPFLIQTLPNSKVKLSGEISLEISGELMLSTVITFNDIITDSVETPSDQTNFDSGSINFEITHNTESYTGLITKEGNEYFVTTEGQKYSIN